MNGETVYCTPCGIEYLPPPEGGPVIRLAGVEKRIDGRTILSGVDLAVPSRRITVIIGLSGAGKSVMLKHMIGLLKPDRGEVLLDGVDINRLSRKELYATRRRYGMLFQGGALFDSMTVFENVAFPLREKTRMSEEEIEARVHRRLSSVGLEEAGDKFPDELSGGMARRVAFARAMVTDPEIILFDEPTTGLDPIIRNSMLNLICHMYHKHGFTMVMISHDIPEIFQWCHYLAVMHAGKVVAFGPTGEVLNSADPVVRQLLDGKIDGPVQLM